MTNDYWLPDEATLKCGLNALFCEQISSKDCIKILERCANIYTSTFSSEIVTCQQSDGKKLKLLLKYGRPGVHAGDVNRGSTDFEAVVYQEVLSPLALSAVTSYGAYNDDANGYTWLVLEYLSEALRLTRAPEQALCWSAHWLGQFHALNEKRLGDQSLPKLISHTADYYLGWARRTQTFSRPLHDQYPWLPTLCQQFETRVSLLVTEPQTIIHGEYYPMNILIEGEKVYPIDWQSVAIARGELDLASLIEGWGHGELVQQSIETYSQVRWGDNVPANFHDVLALAQVFWPLRWLGEKPEHTLNPQNQAHFEYLHEAGQRAGFI